MTRIHKRANTNNLKEAERLLRELFADLEKSKKMQHPQALEIEREWVYSGVSQINTQRCQGTRLKLVMLHAIMACQPARASFTHSLLMLSARLLSSDRSSSVPPFVSMKSLHDRLERDCAIFRDLYNQTLGLELTQTVDVRPVVEVDHPQRAGVKKNT